MNQSAAYVAAYGGEGSSTRVPAKLDRNQQGLRSATFGGPSRSDVGKRKIIPNAVHQLVQKRNFVEGKTKKQGTAGGETGPLRHTHPSIRRSGSTRDPKPGSHALNNGLAHARETSAHARNEYSHGATRALYSHCAKGCTSMPGGTHHLDCVAVGMRAPSSRTRLLSFT